MMIKHLLIFLCTPFILTAKQEYINLSHKISRTVAEEQSNLPDTPLMKIDIIISVSYL